MTLRDQDTDYSSERYDRDVPKLVELVKDWELKDWDAHDDDFVSTARMLLQEEKTDAKIPSTPGAL